MTATNPAAGAGEIKALDNNGKSVSVTVSGGITALNPVDGLFLRAEHLKAMQDFARDLVQSIGIGAGTGVVYGFEVTLNPNGTALDIAPGLGIGPTGRVLRSVETASISLDEDMQNLSPGGFFVIEVAPASWEDGTENAYGVLCDEPCKGAGSAIHPWLREGVTISLRADQINGTGGAIDVLKARSRLASEYFERERQRGGPWVVPGAYGKNEVVPLEKHDWVYGSGQPQAEAVPLGVVQPVGHAWILDVWTARRDVDASAADDRWRSRLGMRPWNIFLAQVLQFQDQWSSVTSNSALIQAALFGPSGDLFEQLTKGCGDEAQEQIANNFADVLGNLQIDAQSLIDMGFDELPPAGYLAPLGSVDESVIEAKLDQLFAGSNVQRTVVAVRADAVAGAVERAQHLDRIPLNTNASPKVEILVPSVGADLEPLKTEYYGWVAFVRSSEQPKLASEKVELHYLKAESVELDKVKPSKGTYQRMLDFPADGWDYPTNAGLDMEPGWATVVLAFTPSTSTTRQTLALERASLFAGSLKYASFGNLVPPPTVILGDSSPEAIMVVQFGATTQIAMVQGDGHEVKAPPIPRSAPRRKPIPPK